jgi:hypothetical protein
MSRILEAEAIVKAKDATGGVFEGIAGKIARINRAANSLSRDIEKQISLANRVEASMSRSERAFRAASRAGHHIAGTAGAAAATYGAYQVERGARAFAHRSAVVGADRAHEKVRERAAGMTAAEIKESEDLANDLSARYKSLPATSLMHMTRNIRSVVGHFEEAKEILDPLAKLRVIAEGAHPERAEELEKDFDQLTKGMEIKGVTQNLPKFVHYMDGMARALNVFGDTLRPTDYYEMFKYGRAATTALSDQFMLETAPTLAQELGGSSAGKALSSFYTQFVGGKMSNKAVAQLQQYGLLDPSKVIKTKTGNVKGVLPGGILGSEYLQPGKTDPYAWVNKILLPHLAAKGITDPAQIQEVIAAMASQTTTAQMMAIFATQQKRIEKDWHLVRGAGGLDSASLFLNSDPKTGLKAVQSQFDNLLTTSGKSLMDPATKGLNWLSDTLSNINAMAEKHPKAAAAANVGVVGGLAASGLALGAYGFKEGANLIAGRPTLTGRGLAALTRFLGPLLPMIMAQFQPDIVNDPNDPVRRRILAASRLNPEEFGALADLDSRDSAFKRTGFGGALGRAVHDRIDRERADIESRLAELGYGPAGLPGRGRMDTVARSDLLTSLPDAPREPVKAEVEGNATLDVNVKVEPSPDFLAKVDQRVDNKINAFRNTATPGSGTAGSLGRSSPDATPPQ